MKIFWSWQSDTPGEIGKYLVRDALREAVAKLKQDSDIEEPIREDLLVDQDIQGVTGSPDLARTIFSKIQESEVVVADVTIVGKTPANDTLINSNVAIELGYALKACTDARVLLVFNKYYGTYEDLPFDLRHKGGAVVFDLSPEVERKEIAVARKLLADEFGRKLKLLLQTRLPTKEPLSLRATIEHRLQRRYPLANGGTDDAFELAVSVENDGEQAATDFKVQLDIPTEFLDGSPPLGLGKPAPPGFSRFEITNEEGPARMKFLYPNTKSPTVIILNYAVRDEIKRQRPEQLEKKVRATVFSGNMIPKTTELPLAQLALVPNS